MDDPLLALLPPAKRRWSRTDPVLHAIAKRAPPPGRALRYDDPFQALVGSIAHQQVSLAAGRTIFARVEEACGGRATAEAALKAGPDRLRAAGLSRPKVGYVLDLAERALSGAVQLDAFPRLADDEIVAQLTTVKGIGVWTAKMHLLFHLSRPDVLPHEDLGLQIAVAKAYGVRRDRAAKRMLALREAWSPYASLAALTLWNWRRLDEG